MYWLYFKIDVELQLNGEMKLLMKRRLFVCLVKSLPYKQLTKRHKQ